MPEIEHPRTLDRLLRSIRSHIRTRRLPRPDRIVISTVSRSMHAEFTSGTAPDRLAYLALWTTTLEGLSLTWTHRAAGLLTVAATGRTAGGISVGLAASAPITELGGRLREPSSGGFAELAKAFTLAPFEHEAITYDELVRVIVSARKIRVSPVAVGAAA
jgi:hypothetical protein